MQVANRTTRRYIPPSAKNTTANLRPTAKKQSSVPPASRSSPKKVPETPATKSNEPPTLKKLIDRFRYDEPQPRPERDSISSDFWWLHDELKNNYEAADDDNTDESRSNIPEFIEIFPSTDIDQDLSKRASLLLNQTFSAHSSDIGHVSSTGIGSTASTTMTTTTTSTFQPVVHEQPARPIFTRITDSKFDMKSGSGDDDILYQWRLRRRLEQAQNGEPITFPSKVTNRSHITPTHFPAPSIPIEIPTILPPPPPPPAVSPPIQLPPSSPPKRERQLSSATNTEPKHTKQPISTTPIPIRQCAEMGTQTLQDACIQTSPIVEKHFPSSNSMAQEIDLHPTRDDDHHHTSVWHRPPVRSKCELSQVSSSPSPIKRHHRHRHHSFRPLVLTDQTTTNHSSHHQPSAILQSSHDSTLTQVTSIMINDHHQIDVIDQSHQHQDDFDDHIDYANDEILNMLIKKRDELLQTFRGIEQRLTDMNIQ